jgi:hypothetical protein
MKIYQYYIQYWYLYFDPILNYNSNIYNSFTDLSKEDLLVKLNNLRGKFN